MSERPLIGLALIVRKDNTVLMHERLGDHQSGTWGFPGGHLELWETFELCALRELHEEAGIILVTQPRFWTVVNCMHPAENKHYVTITMVSDWLAGIPQIMEPTKCAGWSWFPWRDLPEPLMLGVEILKISGKNPFNF